MFIRHLLYTGRHRFLGPVMPHSFPLEMYSLLEELDKYMHAYHGSCVRTSQFGLPEDGLYPTELEGKASKEEVFEVSLERWLGFNQLK